MIFIARSKRPFLAVLYAGLLVTTQPASAQTRFILSEIDNGYILLNQKTGALSICTKAGTDLTCEPESSKPKALAEASQEQAQSPQREIKTLNYYFNKIVSAGLRIKSSTFLNELTKRLFDMIDDLKTDAQGLRR